jgi:hypothetical protein
LGTGHLRLPGPGRDLAHTLGFEGRRIFLVGGGLAVSYFLFGYRQGKLRLFLLDHLRMIANA